MPENNKLPSLDELSRKIEQAKKNSLPEESERVAPGAMHIGIELIAGVLAGSFIGYQLDKWLETLPIFFITFFFLGIAGAVRNIIRSIKNTNSLDKSALDDNKTGEKK